MPKSYTFRDFDSSKSNPMRVFEANCCKKTDTKSLWYRQSFWKCTTLAWKCSYTSKPITAQLFFQEELWLVERCTFSCQNRTRSGTLTVLLEKRLNYFLSSCKRCQSWKFMHESCLDIGKRNPPQNFRPTLFLSSCFISYWQETGNFSPFCKGGKGRLNNEEISAQ